MDNYLFIHVESDSDLKFTGLDFKFQNICILIEKNSRIKLILNQIEDILNFNLSVILKQNSSFDIFINQNCKSSTSRFNYFLLEENSSVNHVQVGVQQDIENQTIFVNQYHETANCSSKVYIKKLLQDDSQSVYKGLISIDKEAIKSKATQEQKVLMFGNKTQNYAMPSLEVKNNQVACNHGAAVGKIDEEILWYMQSRGFLKQLAQKLIIDGFFSDANILAYPDIEIKNILKLLKEKVNFF